MWPSNHAFKMIGLLAFTTFSCCVASPPSDGSLVCRVLAMKVTMHDTMQAGMPERTIFFCERQSDKKKFSLKLPQSFIDQHYQLDIGETIISIRGGFVIAGSDGRASHVEYPVGAEISVIARSSNRRLATADTSVYKTMGTRKLLGVRVTSLDSEPTRARVFMGGPLFGLGGGSAQRVNVISQTQACSFGKLKLVAAKDNRTLSGIIEVFVPVDFRTAGWETFTSEIFAPVQAIYGQDLSLTFDNVLFILPPSATLEGHPFGAAAILRHWASFYSDTISDYVSFVMHELGHNMGLYHSSSGSLNEYGDLSCSMGSTPITIGGPTTCFNGQKNWFLNWFEDRRVEVDGTAAWTGKLAAFTDYNETRKGEHVVLMKVGNNYLQYNKAEKFNAGNRGSQNLITVTTTLDIGNSNLTGTLGFNVSNASSVFYIHNFLGSNYTMVIEACDQVAGTPDYMVVSAYLDDGYQASYCRGGVQRTRAPSPFPSSSPSAVPRPSSSPTFAPVTSPPSTRPTPAPVIKTTRPSPAPITARPSRAPITAPPTPVPTIKRPCEDSKAGVFWVDGGRWATWRDCAWLAKSTMWHWKLCYEPLHHAARDVCPELCGVCTDACSDDKVFSALFRGESIGCEWISTRPAIAANLCKRKDFAAACSETCDTCENN